MKRLVLKNTLLLLILTLLFFDVPTRRWAFGVVWRVTASTLSAAATAAVSTAATLGDRATDESREHGEVPLDQVADQRDANLSKEATP